MEMDEKDLAGKKDLGHQCEHKYQRHLQLGEYRLEEAIKFHERLVKCPTKQLNPRCLFFKDFTKKQAVVLACLCLAEFSSFCSMSIMAPFFPREALKKGMTETTSGFVFSFYALIIFISSPFFGKVLPQMGARFLFLSGLFLTSGCNFLFGLLGYIKEEWVFTLHCFLVQGMKALGTSAYCTASYVFVAEVFPSNIGSVLGVMETFVGLGMSIGPAIGGVFYHVGGFALPFYLLGVILLLMVPVAHWLLPVIQGTSVKKKSGSFTSIFKEPSAIIISLVVIANSNIWAFLDPTLEPHLREFNLTPEKIGFIFLLFSALYGISSPLWGIVADASNNHWFMMTSGLLFSTIGLLLLGPAPFLPFLKNELWLNLVALSVIGISLALSILPTFQGLITSVVKGGQGLCDITTYSIVSGVWSSLYAFGEVIGPLAGGFMVEHHGFTICCMVMAGVTFALAIGTCVFFVMEDYVNNNRKRNFVCKVKETEECRSELNDELAAQPILQPEYSNRLYTSN